MVKVKVFHYKPEVALGVPGGYGSWIFSTFGTMKVVRSSPLCTFMDGTKLEFENR
jgi:hypothetical protein